MPLKDHCSIARTPKLRRSKGTALLETAVGLFVLVPVFFLLIDVIALVVGQTINDDLAKNAARAAAQMTSPGAGNTAASNYINGTLYSGSTGLVRNAGIHQFQWDATNSYTVSVSTSVTIYLPVPVPLGGPSSQVMYAAASEPLIAVPATPATPIPVNSSS